MVDFVDVDPSGLHVILDEVDLRTGVERSLGTDGQTAVSGAPQSKSWVIVTCPSGKGPRPQSTSTSRIWASTCAAADRLPDAAT